MNKSILFFILILQISCTNQKNKINEIGNYNFKIESKCTTQIIDSNLILIYRIKNIDTLNYYIPGSEIWFSGNIDSNYSEAVSTERVFAHHTISYFPIDGELKANFELNGEYNFKKLPYFFLIKPNESIEIYIQILKYKKTMHNEIFNIFDNLDYKLITRFSIINEINFNDFLDETSLLYLKNKIIQNQKKIEIKNTDYDIIKKLIFNKTKYVIDDNINEILNLYLNNHIEIECKLTVN